MNNTYTRVHFVYHLPFKAANLCSEGGGHMPHPDASDTHEVHLREAEARARVTAEAESIQCTLDFPLNKLFIEGL